MRGLWIAGVFVLLIAATGIVAANESPMAEAGLDQEAIVNSTVYLDAGGSLDPDGKIVDYDWSIETPNGTVRTPVCPSCSLTEFVPSRPGQYNVTVTVTDDDGASRNDTLYLVVSGASTTDDSDGDNEGGSSPGPAPSVPGGGGGEGPSLDGPGGGSGSGPTNSLANPSTIARAEDGSYVLFTGDGSMGEFSMTVGGRQVTIPAWQMAIASMDDGMVTFSEVSYAFDKAGATRGDVRHALQNSNRLGRCGGRVCTSIVPETSGEASEDYGDSIEDRIEENYGCLPECVSGENDGTSDGGSQNDGYTWGGNSGNNGNDGVGSGGSEGGLDIGFGGDDGTGGGGVDVGFGGGNSGDARIGNIPDGDNIDVNVGDVL